MTPHARGTSLLAPGGEPTHLARGPPQGPIPLWLPLGRSFRMPFFHHGSRSAAACQLGACGWGDCPPLTEGVDFMVTKLRRLFSSASVPARKPRSLSGRLTLESLETRAAPAAMAQGAVADATS